MKLEIAETIEVQEVKKPKNLNPDKLIEQLKPMKQEQFTYCQGTLQDKFEFLRVPKAYLFNSKYSDMPLEAVVLLSVILDQTYYSIKRGMKDQRGYVYIELSLKEVQQLLRCKEDKARKVLAQLGEQEGIGVIRKVNRGQGDSAIVYLNSSIFKDECFEKYSNSQFSGDKKTDKEEINDKDQAQKSSQINEDKHSYGENREQEHQDAKKTGSRRSKKRNQESDKTGVYKKTETSGETVSLLNTSSSVIDQEIEECRKTIKDNIEFDILTEMYGEALINEWIEYILDIMRYNSDCIVFNNAKYSKSHVVKKFLSIDYYMFQKALEQFSNFRGEIYHEQKFVQNCLWNSINGIESDYHRRVNQDAILYANQHREMNMQATS
ncbi:MAG: hypothetical protein E7256_06635 [Lachnospiraceae bacterium]|nr:hypothetical protein [Lachnospiraceae bacterium]